MQSNETVLEFTDSSSYVAPDVPEASSEVTWGIPAPAGYQFPTGFQVYLNGFSLEMECVTNETVPCNSNGTWPVFFDMSVTSMNRANTAWKGNFSFVRGWTPSHGGGKPYNWRMRYRLRVGYLIVGAVDMDIGFNLYTASHKVDEQVRGNPTQLPRQPNSPHPGPPASIPASSTPPLSPRKSHKNT